MNEMALLKSLPANEANDHVAILQPRLLDNFFIRTGIEKDDLDQAVVSLKLEEDAEYQQILKEYGEAIEKLQKADQ